MKQWYHTIFAITFPDPVNIWYDPNNFKSWCSVTELVLNGMFKRHVSVLWKVSNESLRCGPCNIPFKYDLPKV